MILPEHPWWDRARAGHDGKPVMDGFVYSSDANDWWLTPQELSGLLAPGGPNVARQVERLTAIGS